MNHMKERSVDLKGAYNEYKGVKKMFKEILNNNASNGVETMLGVNQIIMFSSVAPIKYFCHFCDNQSRSFICCDCKKRDHGSHHQQSFLQQL